MSKLILRISSINYVLDKCDRWSIKRDQGCVFQRSGQKCHTSKLILRIYEPPMCWTSAIVDLWSENKMRFSLSRVCECSVSGLWMLYECVWMLCEGSVCARCGRSVIALWMLVGWCVSALWEPSNEISLIFVMYLVLKAIKRCSFWRHGFRKQALLSRWK